MKIAKLVLVAALAACAKKEAPVVYRGMMLTPPRPKPDYVFTATDGKPYDFKKETAGKVALLFFGYTNCPDVCPLHMSNLGNVIKQLPPKDRERVKVVFVTTDPERDTPEKLKAYAAGFRVDHRVWKFLTGPAKQIEDAVVNGFKQGLSKEPDSTEKDGFAILHGTRFVLVDAHGQIRGFYDAQDSAEMARLRTHLLGLVE